MKYVSLLLVLLPVILTPNVEAAPYPNNIDPITQEAQQIEQRLGGRIGIYVRNTQDGKAWHYRENERFPMASTFKVLMCGDLLQHAQQGEIGLSDSVVIKPHELVSHSPVTELHVNRKLSLRTLCAAAIEYSDNTAANLLLNQLGGPKDITRFAQSLGDSHTRLDRMETALNESRLGDPRDTTSPRAMVNSLSALIVGDTLSQESKEQLIQWMTHDQVANNLLRASLPPGWKIADKSGAGLNNTRNLIAIVWPPQRSPLIISIYMTGVGQDLAQADQVIRSLGKIIVTQTSHGD